MPKLLLSRHPLIIAIALAVFSTLGNQAGAEDSSCIICHTDEELLIDNLAPPTQNKSAKQAGAG